MTALIGRGSADTLDTGEMDDLPLGDGSGMGFCDDLGLRRELGNRESSDARLISSGSLGIRFLLDDSLDIVGDDKVGESGGWGETACEVAEAGGLGSRVGVCGVRGVAGML